MGEQLVSTDPNWGNPPAPPHMSAAVPGTAFPGDPNAMRVTYDDMIRDPKGSIQKIGQIVKRDVSDPRLWLGLAASYFGPKVFSAVAPTVARAASSTMSTAGELATPEMAKDLGITALGGSRVEAGLRIADRVRSAFGGGAKEAPAAPSPAAPAVDISDVSAAARAARAARFGSEPAPQPAPAAAPPTTGARTLNDAMAEAIAARRPTSPAGTSAAPAPPAPPPASAQTTVPPPAAAPAAPLLKAAAALKQAGYSEPEVAQAVKWLQQGKSSAEVVKRIEAARAATSGSSPFANLPTDLDVARDVATRNASGKWPTK